MPRPDRKIDWEEVAKQFDRKMVKVRCLDGSEFNTILAKVDEDSITLRPSWPKVVLKKDIRSIETKENRESIYSEDIK